MTNLARLIGWIFIMGALMSVSVAAGADKDYWPLRPVWQSDIVCGESLFFVRQDDGSGQARLLFPAERIVRLYSPALQHVYEQGRDYIHQAGSDVIILPTNSRIPSKARTELYPAPGATNAIKACRTSDQYLFFGEGHLFHDMQVEVDYHARQDTWQGPRPSSQLTNLPRTRAKLQQKQPLHVVIYGDSISAGANASAQVNVPPFQPSYGYLVGYALEGVYGAKVKITNLSKGGKDSAYGAENIQKVIDAHPDLVVIAWGMNDGSLRVSPEVFGQNIENQISAIQAALPECELVLVAGMGGNPEWTESAPELYPAYREQLAELCGPGVILVDVGAVFAEVLKSKAFWSITGNGVNHPNDFGHRLYAQTILANLADETAMLDRAVRRLQYPRRDSTQHHIELLKDRHFKKGFRVLDPKHGAYVVRGELRPDESVAPVWRLAQWHSKYTILNGETESVAGEGFIYTDHTKKVTLGLHDADMTLYLDSNTEFDGQVRGDNNVWPCLLIEQSISDCPNLAELKGLDLHLSACVLQSETIKKQGYDTELHTAQVPYVLVVQNTNENSPGKGDFIWFSVPVYDDRYDYSPPFLAQDIADPSAKMIYMLGTKRFTDQATVPGQWITIHCDLLPIIIDALRVSWERGYLKDSQDLADYSISSMNLGWEMTGLSKAEIAIKDLSLRAVVEQQQ